MIRRDILFNSNDRVIRLYQLEDYDGVPVLRNKFQDLVNRIQWNTTCLSADGEFVVGGKVIIQAILYVTHVRMVLTQGLVTRLNIIFTFGTRKKATWSRFWKAPRIHWMISR